MTRVLPPPPSVTELQARFDLLCAPLPCWQPGDIIHRGPGGPVPRDTRRRSKRLHSDCQPLAAAHVYRYLGMKPRSSEISNKEDELCSVTASLRLEPLEPSDQTAVTVQPGRADGTTHPTHVPEPTADALPPVAIDPPPSWGRRPERRRHKKRNHPLDRHDSLSSNQFSLVRHRESANKCLLTSTKDESERIRPWLK